MILLMIWNKQFYAIPVGNDFKQVNPDIMEAEKCPVPKK